MNAVASLLRPGAVPRAVPPAQPPQPRLGLLGTGTVGAAFVARCAHLRGQGVALPEFAWLSNSRALAGCDPGAAGEVLQRLRAAPARGGGFPPWVESEGLRRGDVIVDATASDVVASWHSEWLLRGIHVATANKLGAGSDSVRAQAIVRACSEGGGRYGDAATVGAGLPLLRSIRALVAGGDRIHAIEGVLSGSLGWLLDRHDASTPFADLVRAACAAGYAEPDPRIDLSGEDVRRKLLILARAAGFAIEPREVVVESLLPPALATADAADVDARLGMLDTPLRERHRAAARRGDTLAYVGRVDAAGARAELRALDAAHPLRAGAGTDNRVAIWSDRYHARPLLIQGPGAGAAVTAAALLDDVLAITRGCGRGSALDDVHRQATA
ncbi:homoserine dehydrogenase [Luteimonas sp. MC1782]|uniref:homoserine dehydrogenase n=1 Tax=Luteimonas sp. MC1782 TaxID=2760305 RepID=UPI001603D227|nr:homoserine dehydrogenase [Luteimonas sp. MC1782]MBB1472766.1 homoserine dehydrogenase [Luteimonas sp. MC1782]